VHLAVEDRAVGDAVEVAPLGGDRGFGQPGDELLGLAPEADQVGDGDEEQAVLGGEALEVGHALHLRAVLGHELAEHAGGGEAGEPGEVDGGLGVAGPLQHAALPGDERGDVAGAGQVGAAGGRVDQAADGAGPVRGGDPGGGAVAEVDGHGEGGAHALGVDRDHERQVELPGPVGRDRGADEAAGVADEEGDGLRGGVLGGHDEVALVLPVLVVGDHDDLAPGDGVDGLGNGGVGGHGAAILAWPVARWAASSFSACLAMMSTSRLTRSPGRTRCGG